MGIGVQPVISQHVTLRITIYKFMIGCDIFPVQNRLDLSPLVTIRISAGANAWRKVEVVTGDRRRSRFAKNNLVWIIVGVKRADKRKWMKWEWRLEWRKVLRRNVHTQTRRVVCTWSVYSRYLPISKEQVKYTCCHHPSDLWPNSTSLV